jgi:hypothetical protein
VDYRPLHWHGLRNEARIFYFAFAFNLKAPALNLKGN